jgi:hypothetical protein
VPRSPFTNVGERGIVIPVETKETVMTIQIGAKVTYQKNKRERGNATVERVSTTKKHHVYIKTETEGTLLVPVSELLPSE